MRDLYLWEKKLRTPTFVCLRTGLLASHCFTNIITLLHNYRYNNINRSNHVGNKSWTLKILRWYLSDTKNGEYLWTTYFINILPQKDRSWLRNRWYDNSNILLYNILLLRGWWNNSSALLRRYNCEEYKKGAVSKQVLNWPMSMEYLEWIWLLSHMAYLSITTTASLSQPL